MARRGDDLIDLVTGEFATFTGLGDTPDPRPRRLSGRVITNATSTPAATKACSGGTATSGVPRYTTRRAAPVGKAASPVTGTVTVIGTVTSNESASHQFQVEWFGIFGLIFAGAIQLDCLATLVWGHAIKHEHPVEVIHLVLKQARQ